MDLHEQRLDIWNSFPASQVLHRLLKPLRNFFLLRSNSVHNLQIPIYALDLALQLALFSDVEEGYDEVAKTVVDVGMGQSRKNSCPFPILFCAEGVLAGLYLISNQRLDEPQKGRSPAYVLHL